jgi:hypothetical protein
MSGHPVKNQPLILSRLIVTAYTQVDRRAWFQHRKLAGIGVADFCGYRGRHSGWVFCIGRFRLPVGQITGFWLWTTDRTGTLDGAVGAPCQKRRAHADLQFHGDVNITGEDSLN